MARKNLNRGLGALAALGALSYHLSRGSGRTDGGAPVEYRGADSRNDPTAIEGVGVTEIGMGDRAPISTAGNRTDEDIRRFADVGTNFNELGQPYSLIAQPSAGPAAGPAAAGPAAVRPTAGPTARPPAAPTAAARAPINDREHVFSGPMTPRIPEGSPSYYDPRMANLSSAAVGRGEADAIRNAANAQRPLREQLTDTTLGVPTSPAPGAPSIYAGPEAWRLYNQQKAAEAAAAGPSAPQGSARNIRQQMREKDKEVLAAVRRRQEEEAKTKQTAREADAERLREARRVQRPASNPSDLRFRDMQKRMGLKKGGATKKMASGGMTSASKRGDGIASKGKTKCKMY